MWYQNLRLLQVYLVLLLLAAPHTAVAQRDYAAAMEPADFGSPGIEHELLSRLAGVWDAQVSITGNGASSDVHLTLTAEMVMDGRFLQETIRGRLGTQRLEVVGLTGFNRAEGKFEAVWLENVSGSTLLLVGRASPDFARLEFEGQYADPVTNEIREISARRIIESPDAQQFVWYELLTHTEAQEREAAPETADTARAIAPEAADPPGDARTGTLVPRVRLHLTRVGKP